MANSVFGGKRNTDYWKKVFEDGTTPEGQKIIGQKINLLEMMKNTDS